ncbi:ankyrin repeat domain protein [Plakobranchus ocellatus]|uniref:Ankyrin repeat domain protein n=1 Tax=Plakobranchus ocellatus TaxID=259542 RepID=A0AAV4E209_9GAST|nr:ankyrin repeat domain protein [Plakobranchus ocellatus]
MTALMKAVEAMDIDAIRILMSANLDETKTNKKGQTAKDIAVNLGISEVFEYLKYETEKNYNSYDYHSALTKAMLESNIQAVKILLDCTICTNREYMPKYNFDNEDQREKTLSALVTSMCSDAKNKKKPDHKKLKIAKILLDSGSHPDKRSGLRVRSCLTDATKAGVYDLVEILCNYEDFRPDSYNFDHPALKIAAKEGFTDIVKLLLTYMPGANGDRRNYFGDSALTMALENSQIECAKILLQDHTFSEAHLDKVALKAVQSGRHEGLDLLVSHCNFKKLSQSLLKPAVQSGSTKTVQFLLNQGADVNVCCGNSSVALLLALKHLSHSKLMEMVTFLVENGAHVNRSVSNESPLVRAVSIKEPEIVRYLLEKGADVNEVGDDEGNTALMAAFSRRYRIMSFTYETLKHREIMNVITEVVELMLEAGADPNKTNCVGNTAIHVAIAESCLEAMPLLLKAGAELEVRNSDGLTPLLLAADEGRAAMISLLKRHGANMAALDDHGSTSLLRVMQRSRPLDGELLRLLAYDKDQVNKQTTDGLTPLMLAARKCDLNAIKILLELGADPNVVNNSSENTCTALSILLDCSQITGDILPCVEELIKHNGLASVPKRCCLALFKMIMSDKRQMVQLMVMHGVAPVCVNFNTVDSLPFQNLIRTLKQSVKESLSPLATALILNRLEIARYLMKNWFLTKADLVGSPQLPGLRNELESLSKTEAVSFMEEHLSQPMSLIQLSFVAVSASLGETAGREERIRNIPLPTVLQDKLLFRYDNTPIDLTCKDNSIYAEQSVLVGEDALTLSLLRSMIMNSTRERTFHYYTELNSPSDVYYDSDDYDYYTTNDNYESD